MNITPTTPRWLRVQQAADLLGVSPNTVRRWVAQGRIACRRAPSGQRRFLADDLERVLGNGHPASPERPPVVERAEQRERLLFETSLDLASSLELGQVLQSAAQRLCAVLEIPDCDVYRLEDGERLVCLASTVAGVRDSSWVGREFQLGEWLIERLAIETHHAITVASLDDPRLSEWEREAMRGDGQHSSVALPLIAGEKVIGVVDLLDHVERRYTDEEIATAEAVGQLVALALDHAQLHEEVKHLHLGNLQALSSALNAKDYYTLGHASRVAAYMALLGAELGWSEERLDLLQNVAFLHDIGKIGISDRVLLKPGPLTAEEWQLMRQHPGISAEIVRPLFDEELVAGVRHHHERFDGHGYPDGLAGEAIPPLARAMCVVDCYDAMSCWRAYRRALNYRQCLAELKRCSGAQFDPAMVAAFRRALQRLQRRQTRIDKLAAQAARSSIPPSTRSCVPVPTRRARSTQRMVRDLRALPRRATRKCASSRASPSTASSASSSWTPARTEDEMSHVGDPWLDGQRARHVLAGESLQTNVLTADEFGVWVVGHRPDPATRRARWSRR